MHLFLTPRQNRKNDIQKNYLRASPYREVVNRLDYDIVVNEFELQSRFYVHFRVNTFGKGMNPLILSAIG